MTPTNQPWTNVQLTDALTRLDQLIYQPCFNREADYSPATEAALITILRLEDTLLKQAELAGQRIDFLDEVGTNGRIEDITSLLRVINRELDVPAGATGAPTNDEPLRTGTSPINHFYGAGWGYFQANGLVFECRHEDELAFFVGPYRVLFFRHLVRAYQEAKTYFEPVLS